MAQDRLVILFVKDLIFRSRIASAASAQGLEVRSVRTVADLENALAAAPACGLIADLNGAGAELDQLCEVARARVPQEAIFAYYSHVDTELAAAAKAAGLSNIMPRSRLVNELSDILAALGTSTRGSI